MIRVYSKQNCMQCIITKNYLSERQIEFYEIDVSLDTETMDYLREQGFYALPVVVVDGLEPWYGFRPDKLDQLC